MPNLFATPLHLGLGATAVVEPDFTGVEWYGAYEARHASDGADGRLVSMYRFTSDWEAWESHPCGAEVVLCVAGRMIVHQEGADGAVTSIALGPGDYAINPPGVWHTADIEGEATALFITPGKDTAHRPR